MTRRLFRSPNSTHTPAPLHHPHRQFSDGFTIVELLIVVIVIAILATITIVSFNGVQNRAKTSSVQASVRQAYTKIKTHALDNNDQFPASASQSGIVDSSSATYQYYVNNASNPKRVCISARKDAVVYYMTQSQNSPQPGSCSEQNIASTNFSAWESGDYSQLSGEPYETSARLRQVSKIAVTPGASYTFSTGAVNHPLIIRAFAENQSFATSIGGIASGTVVTMPANVYFITLAIYGPGSLNYETYSQAFADGSLVPSVVRVDS